MDNNALQAALRALSETRRKSENKLASSLSELFINQNLLGERSPSLLSLAAAAKPTRSLADLANPFGGPDNRPLHSLRDLLTPPPKPEIDFSFLARLSSQPKRKVFISYHHGNDQWAYDHFGKEYGEDLELFYDNSLDGKIRSDDSEYVNRTIREEHIVGSSITIVLIGPETWKRKYVDWEVRSTLHEKHALLGLALHTAPKTWEGKTVVPDRLHHNVVSGYAHFLQLSSVFGPAGLKVAIEAAIEKSKNTQLIDNSFPKMFRNCS